MYAESVLSLVENASSFGSAGIFVLVVFGLFTKFGNSLSAFLSLIIGMFVWIYATYIAELNFAYLASLSSAFISYIIGIFISNQISKIKK
jgi:Na+/proline symporter